MVNWSIKVTFVTMYNDTIKKTVPTFLFLSKLPNSTKRRVFSLLLNQEETTTVKDGTVSTGSTEEAGGVARTGCS